MDFAGRVAELLPWIRRAARRYCHGQDADDLASETVLRLLLYGERFDAARDVKPLASVVMRHTFLTWRGRQEVVCMDDLPERAGEGDASLLAELHDALGVLRRCASVSVCVESVVLHAVGYSYEEIACRLGVPVGTVRSRISSGRRLIAQELKNVSTGQNGEKW